MSKPARPSAYDSPFRVVFIIVGVLLIQLALAASYLGAWHDPEAKSLPLAVAGPAALAQQVADSLQSNSNGAFTVAVLEDAEAAGVAIRDQEIYGAVVLGAEGDTVLVASARNASLARSLPGQLEAVSTMRGVSQTVEDIAPLVDGDRTGLGIFYTAFSWVFGGYFLAASLFISRTGRERHDRHEALRRITLFVAFAAASGVGTAAIAINWMEVLPQTAFWSIAGLGAAVVLATSLFSSSIVSLLGSVGAGIVVLFFVIMGNPASGGTIPVELSGAGPWHMLAPYLPTGAAVSALRGLAYFNAAHLAPFFAVFAAYGLAGAVILLVTARAKDPDTPDALPVT